MANIPDTIIEGCRKGDSKNQERLYRLVAPVMYGLCLRYAGDEGNAMDIMQDGFIKVFRKIGQFSGKGSMEGWIRRIMINTALERYRGRVIMEPIDDKAGLQEDFSGEDTIDTITAGEITALISSLTPKYRMVFNLYAIEGYSHKEISQMLGISEGTSKSNLSRARTVLQEKMKVLYKISRESK
ncbi:MAG TPA: RNA polymerase sigma factor [Bacteroidales bacterium]|nr:RNA polymerase sigma factor [Bacteroidales bacterium]